MRPRHNQLTAGCGQLLGEQLPAQTAPRGNGIGMAFGRDHAPRDVTDMSAASDSVGTKAAKFRE